MYKTSVTLDESLVERFRSYYPQNGSLSWFFNECLKTFIKIHAIEFDEEMKQTVEEALKEISEEEEP